MYSVTQSLSPRSIEEKKVTRILEGGSQSDPPPSPSTFNTIHPIGMMFGTYSKLPLYFELSETTWCLFSFHGSKSYMNEDTSGRHLGFTNFRFYSNLNYSILLNDKKIQYLAIEIYKIYRIHCKVVSI